MLMLLTGCLHLNLTLTVFQEASLDSLILCPQHHCHLNLLRNILEEIRCCHGTVSLSLKDGPKRKLGEPFFPYKSRRYELSVQDGVLLWGSRIVVPPRMRNCVLDELHKTHQGIVKIKGPASRLCVVAWDGLHYREIG